MHPRHVLAGIIALLGVTLSCSSSTEPTATLSPSLSTISAAASTLVADGVTQTVITVTLKDTDGAPYRKSGGVLVLSTTGGTLGSVSDLNNGNYSATLTSSRTAGAAVIRANIAGNALTSTASVTFVAGPAAAIGVANPESNNQSAVAGSNVANPPSVKVTDANGNAVSGQAVTFAVASGGGSVTGAAPTTDVNGVATAGSWKLGPIAGNNTLVATTSSSAAAVAEGAQSVDRTVTFTATGVAGGPSSIAVNGGGAQTAVAGGAVATPPSVKVVDANNNPVNGVTVNFAVASGGGSLTGAVATTNASGIATVGSWTLGPIAGPNSLTASSGSLSGSPVNITATGVAGPAGALSIVAGNNQSAVAGTNVAIAPAVKVTDVNGNAVAAATVTFTVVSGGGSVTDTTTLSNADGIATPGAWKVGDIAGTNTMAATSGSLAGVVFTATGTTGAAASIAINAGNNQSAVAGNAVAIPPSVVVTDSHGNVVPNVSVTFAIASGGGTVTGASVTTDASGIATVGSWTLGSVPGANTLTASSSALSGSPVLFNATGTAGQPAGINIAGGNGQSAIVGTTVATAPTVRVTGSEGQLIAGVAVTFSIASGGGSITGATALTDASGIAAVGSWKLGLTAGTNTMSATVGDLAPVTFTATGTAGAATTLAANAGNNQTAFAGTPVGVSPSVKVTDANDNAVTGTPVTFAVASGGGSISGATTTTDANGIAAVGSWTLGSAAGPNSLTAAASGLAGSPVTFNATGQALPPLGVDVTGLLERGETVTVTVTQNGSALPPSGYTLTVIPSDGATVNALGTLKLLKSGSVTINANASGGAAGSRNITVATPPSVVFDLLNNGNRDIWRVAIDGGDLQQLTTDPADDQHPSAAAGKLVFSSSRAGGNLHVYVQPLAGGSATRITPTNTQADTEPRISRNGQRFAYISNETGIGRATYANIDGSNSLPVDVTTGGAIEFAPDWAPASDRIVFGSTAAGAADVYFANTLGAVATYFPGNSASDADLQPVYSPDGTRIAFISNRDGGNTDIYVANVDGSNMQKVVTNASGPAWVRSDRLVYETVVFTPGQPLKGSLHWIDPSNPAIVHDINVGAGDARNASPIY